MIGAWTRRSSAGCSGATSRCSTARGGTCWAGTTRRCRNGSPRRGRARPCSARTVAGATGAGVVPAEVDLEPLHAARAQEPGGGRAGCPGPRGRRDDPGAEQGSRRRPQRHEGRAAQRCLRQPRWRSTTRPGRRRGRTPGQRRGLPPGPAPARRRLQLPGSTTGVPATPPSTRRCGTIEGITQYERSGHRHRLRRAAARAGRRRREFLLRHHLYRSVRTGAAMHPEFTRLHHPARWHFDVLRGLEALADAGTAHDARMDDALRRARVTAVAPMAAGRRTGPAPGRRTFRTRLPGEPHRWVRPHRAAGPAAPTRGSRGSGARPRCPLADRSRITARCGCRRPGRGSPPPPLEDPTHGCDGEQQRDEGQTDVGGERVDHHCRDDSPCAQGDGPALRRGADGGPARAAGPPVAWDAPGVAKAKGGTGAEDGVPVDAAGEADESGDRGEGENHGKGWLPPGRGPERDPTGHGQRCCCREQGQHPSPESVGVRAEGHEGRPVAGDQDVAHGARRRPGRPRCVRPGTRGLRRSSRTGRSRARTTRAPRRGRRRSRPAGPRESTAIEATSAARAVTASWPNPRSPMPTTLPPSRALAGTRASRTSTTRLDFSSTTPVSTRLP